MNRLTAFTTTSVHYFQCLDSKKFHFPLNNVNQIRIGMLVSENVTPADIGHATTGGAVAIALDRIRDEHLLDEYNFTFHVRTTDCEGAPVIGSTLEFLQKLDVHAVLGPSCNGINAGTMSTAYSLPMFAWGYTFASDLTEDTGFPYLSTISGTSLSLAYALMQVLEHFAWDKFAFLYSRNAVNYCTSMATDVEFAVNDPDTFTSEMVYKSALDEDGGATYDQRLLNVKERARIIVVCMPNGPAKRRFFSKVSQLGMATDEFVYILLELKSVGYGQAGNVAERLPSGLSPFWADTQGNNSDGLTELAKEGARKTLVLDLSRRNDGTALQFGKEVIERVRGPPLYCDSPKCLALNNQSYAGIFARSLHDAFYLYASALNRTLTQDPLTGLRNPGLLKRNLKGTFMGQTGEVIIGENGARDPFYFVYSMDNKNIPTTFINITVDTSLLSKSDGCNNCAVLSPYYTDDVSTIWAPRSGGRPLATPKCGFLGNSCPKDFWGQNGIIVGIAIGLAGVITLALIVLALYFFRERRKEKERLNAMWQISNRMLDKPSSKRDRMSMRSLSSTGASSTSTKLTRDTDLQETSTTAFYYYDKDLCIAIKHASTMKFDHYETNEFRKMRSFDHENVNKFIGLSLDGPILLSLWRHGTRGNIEQVISRGTMQLDSFFVFSLIKDIVHGLEYLHSSFLGVHGNLTSQTCLVDDRWQVKISDYGLRIIRVRDKVSNKRVRWQAPELIRDQTLHPTKQMDIFAFAIVASEILTRKPAYNAGEKSERLDELVYMIKKGGHNPRRPELTVADGIEVNAAMLHMIRDCWAESPEDRPTIVQVKSIMRSMASLRQQNLMDHVFNMMEQYAGTLEEEVHERTKELIEEKKKSDVLLYRMLPRQVAEKLKLGQSVEPVSFESVTIFFSDVVKFTQLSQKCSPIQIVNLLNELYTSFDTIIENQGVYKVETIGDGYLCVSGLPHRNGTEHVRDISEMALDFMSAVRAYRILHLPNETVALRIGINTGPCVAGVVGLTMPRYCLFGDTVNTGSRMESNGKPGMIHMSAETHKLLCTAYAGRYHTQSRGDVIIKGKGVMETFWLTGRISEFSVVTPPSTIVSPPFHPTDPPPDPQFRIDSTPPLINHQIPVIHEQGLYEDFLGNQ